MKIKTCGVISTLFRVFFLISICAPVGIAGTVVLEGARLIDGTGNPPIEKSVLVIEGNRIKAVGAMGSVPIPEGARVIDLGGKTIIPALINLHGHVGLTRGLEQATANYNEENILAQLEKYLAYGVGTVVSLGNDQDLVYSLRERQRAGKLPGARLYTAGRGFGVPGGYPPGLASPADRYRPQTPEQARDEVRELAPHRPDFVKIWVDDDFGRLPKMKPEIYQAIIEEAHRNHLRVVAHVFYLGDAKALVRAGIDGLGHSVRDLPVDQELIAGLKARGVFLVPTLARDESTFAYAKGAPWLVDPFFEAGVDPAVLATLRSPAFLEKSRATPNLARLEAAFEMARRNLKTLSDAGVKIAGGTDSGPPLRFQGYSEQRELRLMVEAGLTPMQAIVAFTSAGAEALGAKVEFGALAPGKIADFLVLDANPLEDIRNTEKLASVWHEGKPTKPVSASPRL